MGIREDVLELLEHIRQHPFLQPDYFFGYEVEHADREERWANFDHRSKRQWRRRLQFEQSRGSYGAGADLAAIPADAGDAEGAQLMIELVHLPSEIRVVRWYSTRQVKNLANRTDITVDEKKTIIRNQIVSFKAELDQRVTDSGWTP